VTGGPHTESCIACQAHRGDDIRRASSHHNECGVLVGVQIPGLARLVVAVFARNVGSAPQTCPKLLKRRTVEDPLHGELLLFDASSLHSQLALVHPPNELSFGPFAANGREVSTSSQLGIYEKLFFRFQRTMGPLEG
jgi:hypothetical protein